MRYDQIYSQPEKTAQAQPTASAQAPTRNTQPQAPTMAGSAVTISWVGILLALVILRIVYEVS